MVLIRLLVFISLVAIAVALGGYLIGKDRRYLTFAWQILKFSTVVIAAFLTFYALERLVLIL